MTKYLIHIVFAILGCFYAIAFSAIPGPFPFWKVMGAILLAGSASLYLNRKNTIAAIIAVIGLLVFAQEILGNWKHLFDDSMPSELFISALLFVVFSTGFLFFGLFLSVCVLVKSNKDLFEIEKLNNYNGKYIKPILSVAIPLIIAAWSGWIYLAWD